MVENRKYNAPKFEIIEIECEDVILTSGLTDGGTGGTIGDSSVLSSNPSNTSNTANTANLFD